MKDIAEATPKVIENILNDISVKVKLGNFVRVFILTAGLSYTFNKLAGKLYLMPKIDSKTHLLMRTIAIGLEEDTSFDRRNLYESNELYFKIKESSWTKETELKKIEALRNEFRAKVKKLETK